MSKKAVITLSVVFLAISSLLIAATYTTPNLQLYEKKPPQTSSTIALNSRSESKYVGRQVFIVSDKDWRDVIGLVPVAMWKEGGGLKKYPVLVWHEEEGGFDADSVIFFIEQYIFFVHVNFQAFYFDHSFWIYSFLLLFKFIPCIKLLQNKWQ